MNGDTEGYGRNTEVISIKNSIFVLCCIGVQFYFMLHDLDMCYIFFCIFQVFCQNVFLKSSGSFFFFFLYQMLGY